MIKRLLRRLSNLPIKWRLTFWSSLLLCVLFLFYNAAQYIVIHQWTMDREQSALQKSMDQVLEYFGEKGSGLRRDDIIAGKQFLEKLNQPDQLIRILDEDGHPVVAVSDGVSQQWVMPEPAGERSLQSVWHYQEHLLVLRSPLNVGNFRGTIEIVNNLETFDRFNDTIVLVMVIGFLGAAFVSGVGGLLLARQLLRPIATIADTMRRIKHNGLQERVRFKGNQDELSRLAVMFNEMMDRLEASFQQQRQFVEDASHELRTPIAIIEGHLALLNRWGKKDPAVLDESLVASMQELGRLKGLVQEMLTLTQAESIAGNDSPEGVAPISAIRGIVDDFSMLHADFQFDVDVDTLSGIEVLMPAHHFKQVVMIVLDNAVKYSADRKRISITGSLAGSAAVRLRIEDYGIGIPDKELPHVFDRFYRVDKARSRKLGGSGLGLAIAKRLIEHYQGAVAITSREKEGTAVTLTLPAASEGGI